MTTNHQLLDGADIYSANTPALLDRQIDDLLLHARGLAVVRDLLTKKGASRDEVAAHSRELESTRTRLADLIRGVAPQVVSADRAFAVVRGLPFVDLEHADVEVLRAADL